MKYFGSDDESVLKLVIVMVPQLLSMLKPTKYAVVWISVPQRPMASSPVHGDTGRWWNL